MNPFPLNKMFHINYKIAEEGLIYIDYKVALFTTKCKMAEVYLRRS